MKTIFLTGATGTMGWAGLKELLRFPDKYKVRVLSRPSQKNKQKLAPLADKIDIVWGDLTNYDDILKCVSGSEIVLHVGGMVSPQADYRPNATRKTNLLAAEYIYKAILSQENQPKLVYIGSVAQMGDRREPIHWGRTGDPICVSAYDHYGLTKVIAERVLTGGKIKQWVSLRQSGILYPAILKNFDPIMFHVPIRGVLEWATIEDSGRLLERVCRDEVPEEFWNRYYNIGSGEQYRLTNYEFEKLLLEAIGCPKPEKIFNPKWFVTRNFHGMWYLDSDVLESYLHFRQNIPVKDYFEQMSRSKTLPLGIRFAKATKVARLVPHLVKLAMLYMANRPEHGTQTWIKESQCSTDEQRLTKAKLRVAAYYGSLDSYNKIPDWKQITESLPSSAQIGSPLWHGYDESKPMSELSLQDLQSVAEFRGWKLLSENHTKGDWDIPLLWQCSEGHLFEATPRLILLGGHGCPECMPNPYKSKMEHSVDSEEKYDYTRPWNWDEVAKNNPFFAQIWAPVHDSKENNTYDYHIFDGWE